MFSLLQERAEQERDVRNLHTLIVIHTYGVPVGKMAKAVGCSRQTIYRRMAAARRTLRIKESKAVMHTTKMAKLV